MNTDFARQKMVEQQVRAWDVFDPEVLSVLESIPREQFVPFGYESLAFADTEIPLAHGQHMMTPTLEGRVLQALDLNGIERVLEVGSGSGFLSACLCHLADHVVSLEIHDDIAKRARDNLADAGLANVEIVLMDAMKDLPDGAFDAIAVTGSIQHFDPRFAEKLAPDGRLFVVVGDAPVMDARLVHKTGENDWETESLFETVLDPLINGSLPPLFSF
jgi:protein-L-isoaspartate(D-aspartate) O-methyltransferase